MGLVLLLHTLPSLSEILDQFSVLRIHLLVAFLSKEMTILLALMVIVMLEKWFGRTVYMSHDDMQRGINASRGVF